MDNQSMYNETMKVFNPDTTGPSRWPWLPKIDLDDLKGPKMIFVILGLIILVELGFALNSYFSKRSTVVTTPPKTVQTLTGGQIALVTEKNQYSVGETVSVVIRTFTGGKSTDGTDVVINYDTNILEISSTDLQKGTVYPSYPNSLVDGKGKIFISGIAPENSNFNGAGIFATLNFKARAVGSSKVTLDFAPGSTTDSNMIESDTIEDVLLSVNDLSINIAGSSGTVSSGSCSSKVYTRCFSGGSSGTYHCTPINDPYSCQIGCFKAEDSRELGCNVTTAKK